ncbi:MAG: hypothetical protein ACRCZI_10445 [Cetobacterium sp.]
MDVAQMIKEEKLRAMVKQEQGFTPETPMAEVPAEEVVTPRDVMKALKPAALPLLGSAAGTVAGMLSGPAAPFLTPALEAAGGMGGEKVNQLLGITEPSNSAIALQGILPLGTRGVSAVAKVIPSATKGAKFLNEIAPVEAANRLETVRKSVPEVSRDLFQKAEASGSRIPTLTTQAVIKKELTDRLQGGSASSLYKGTREYLETLGDSIKKRQGAMSPTQYQRELRDLNSMIGKATTDVERGALMNVKSTLDDALDTAPAGAELMKARKLYAREKVFEDLSEFSGKAEKVKQGKGGLEQFNAGEVLRKIEHDDKFSKRFKSALSPSEQKEVKKIYTLLNEIPALPSDAGVLGRLGGDVSQGLKIGAASHLIGADPAVSTAMALGGSMLRPAMDTVKVMKLALSTDEGRKILLKELTARKDKPLREVLQKVAVGLSATETAQDFTREIEGPTQAFPNMR